jgi:hypothetical protein
VKNSYGSTTLPLYLIMFPKEDPDLDLILEDPDLDLILEVIITTM